MEKAEKFLEIFFFLWWTKIFQKKKEKNFIKFLSGRGSKSLQLTVFLGEKKDPNYDTAYSLNLTFKFYLFIK
jgi:hypothetical protein